MYGVNQTTTKSWSNTLELTQDETNITVGLTARVALSANPDRIAVIFQNIGAGSITLSTFPGVPGGTGFLLAAGSVPLIISDDNLPGLASRSWYAVALAAAASLEIFSVRLT